MINKVWNVFPGFLLWMLWKERNRQLFKQLNKKDEDIWQGIQDSIRELISTFPWPRQAAQG
jgi:hypothetical protein